MDIKVCLILFLAAGITAKKTIQLYGQCTSTHVRKDFQACKDSLPESTQEDLEFVARGVTPMEPGEKDILACYYTKIGLIKDNKFSEETFLKIVEHLSKICYKNIPNWLEHTKYVGEACKNIEGSTPQETALNVRKCLKENTLP